KVGFDQILQGHIADKRLAFKNYAKKQGFRTPVRLGPSITPQQARPQIEKLDKIAKDYEKKTGLTLTRQDKYGSLASHAKKLGY
ncbi:MAG: hypothetical protein KJO12_10190, partial [Ignavibacteria bacterium]|nr:hypothetical protein [Ignavibacteria bacterium]